VHAIKRAKEDAWRKLCDLVDCDTWGLPYKLLMGKLSRPPPIPELNATGRIEHIVNGLFPQHPRREISTWYHNPLLVETHPKIDLAELKSAAGRLRNKIAPGIDGIPNEAVKAIVALNPNVILSVYNSCLTEWIFPRKCKIARLVLLRKGDKPLSEPSSYRPLCLLDCLGKLLENILDTRLRCHLENTGSLDDRQFGFRRSKVGILTMDIKNAFNSAPWAAIMKAVQEKDVPEYLQQMVSSYLDNRRLQIETGEGTTEIEVFSSDQLCGTYCTTGS